MILTQNRPFWGDFVFLALYCGRKRKLQRMFYVSATYCPQKSASSKVILTDIEYFAKHNAPHFCGACAKTFFRVKTLRLRAYTHKESISEKNYLSSKKALLVETLFCIA